MIQLGWCAPVSDAEVLREAGFDYIECGISSLQVEDTDKCRQQIEAHKNAVLPASAFNLFFPGDIHVVGNDVPTLRVKEYVKRAAAALEEIGASIAVLGSGRSRNVPEDFEHVRADEQFLSLLRNIDEAFQTTNVTLAIEPLNKKESNLINSVGEAVEFAKQVNSPKIRVLADFYHMDEDDEPLSEIVTHADWLAHIHVADTGRLHPGSGHYPYQEFVKNLHAINYDGMVSVECQTKNFASDAKESAQFLKDVLLQGANKTSG
ncbi:sugar phosphate isomerase/epimerase family protein [Aureibacillus halotolerans]|uniref:Sugar phosphate isomerase/epimerase n=1 Tax=Aureibacillus halotolerans TaxID=1508390 RepID=A0A4R6UAT7_9BACI|nr:sugar phosphate isomerase/epimerase family protein [Aureibacillus halotolerans]TDQ43012.1 sugar phosphate isomerase/epimerase [Aureibacillus halotolerans]